MRVNKPPVAPYYDPAASPVPATGPNEECLVFPGTGKALIETFSLSCNMWTDPDDIGITEYRVERKIMLLNIRLYIYLH